MIIAKINLGFDFSINDSITKAEQLLFFFGVKKFNSIRLILHKRSPNQSINPSIQENL